MGSKAKAQSVVCSACMHYKGRLAVRSSCGFSFAAFKEADQHRFRIISYLRLIGHAVQVQVMMSDSSVFHGDIGQHKPLNCRCVRAGVHACRAHAMHATAACVWAGKHVIITCQ